MIETKTCTKCGRELPATIEYFGRSSHSKDGFGSWCKGCKALSDKLYRQKNKEKIAARQKKYAEKNKDSIKKHNERYYQDNKQVINEKNRQYYYNNKEKCLNDVKTYRENNKDKISARVKKYRERNKQIISQYQKQWYENNKERVLQKVNRYREENDEIIKLKKKQFIQANPGYNNNRAQRYRAKKMQLVATLTDKQWKCILITFKHECAYCGKSESEQRKECGEPLHREHFIPVSRGGEYTHDNIIPACKSCNSSKRDKDFFAWYHKQTFYNKKRENKILQYLNYRNEIPQKALYQECFFN